MAIGISIGIGIPSGALNSNNAGSLIPGLLASLCARATYCENASGTTTILTALENCK